MSRNDDLQRRSLRYASGFTLLELMVTVAIGIILVLIALPTFQATIINSRVTQTGNALLRDLNLARAEAVRRGTLVAVISNSGTNDWSTGWYVQADGKFLGNGTFTAQPVAANDPDVVLDNNSGVNTTASYSVKTKATDLGGTGIAPSDKMIIFNSQGSLIPRTSGFAINVCRPDHKPTKSKYIQVSTSGIVTLQTDTTTSPAPACP